jgi:hypothetical protein
MYSLHVPLGTLFTKGKEETDGQTIPPVLRAWNSPSETGEGGLPLASTVGATVFEPGAGEREE